MQNPNRIAVRGGQIKRSVGKRSAFFASKSTVYRVKIAKILSWLLGPTMGAFMAESLARVGYTDGTASCV